MSKSIGIRELKKQALLMGAAMVENADFDNLFGEDTFEALYGDEKGEALMEKARVAAVKRIRRLAGQ